MEGKKQHPGSQSSSSSSSFTSELFGSKESSLSSSSGIFGSIFAPSSKVLGRESLRPERKEDSSAKHGAPDYSARSLEGDNQNTSYRDMSSIYEDQRVQPCHLSSSIYYGGQDVYHHPQSNQSTNINSTFKKDGTEDDSGGASRGNWWQGSLYY
ncbi:unnamed protein product [Linum tenue]|uniref:Uncharacterized protein n=2 Tax=Linum TaxID=4005 RepID=A0AAV0L0H6_9ROSI|nr:unnamed protein product [Linum tenue]